MAHARLLAYAACSLSRTPWRPPRAISGRVRRRAAAAGAIHAGALVSGEMGDWKREIVMLGDTMNTTARIENVCRTKHWDYIASAVVLERIGELSPSLTQMFLDGESQAEVFRRP